MSVSLDASRSKSVSTPSQSNATRQANAPVRAQSAEKPLEKQGRLDLSKSAFDSTAGTTASVRARLLGGPGPAQSPVAALRSGPPAPGGRTPAHDEIVAAANATQVKPGTREWSDMDILKWKTPVVGDPNHIFEFKEQWVQGYQDTIRAAAQQYNLPETLVAGVAFNEVGGDPAWVDDLAHSVRTFDHLGDPLLEPLTITRPPDQTSFGNVSMQVRRAAETLGYDPANLSREQESAIIDSLKDPRQNIFIAARHLAELRDIDFPGAKTMTEDQIRVTATRFNRGPDLSLDQIRQNTSYGNVIINRSERLQELMQ